MKEKEQAYAKTNADLLKKGRSAQTDWLENVDRWVKYSRLSQWSAADENKMKSHGLPVLTHDFILPCVEQGVSFLTHNSPRFHALGVDQDDTELGSNVSDLLSHIWRISSGDTEYETHCKDWYVKSQGVWKLYEDPDSDNGKGDLKIMAPDPRDIVWSSDSTDPLGRDADWVIHTFKMTRPQVKRKFPGREEEIDQAQGQFDENPRNSSTVMSTSGHVEEGDFSSDTDKLDYIERYEKVMRERHMLLFNDDGEEIGPLTPEQFANAKKIAYAIVTLGDKVDIMTEDEARMLMADPAFMGSVKPASLDELIEMEMVDHAKYYITRVMKYCSLGTSELHKEELPISEYPIIPCFNKHNGNPFAMSDVAGVISLQDFYNKVISLVTENIQRSTAAKALGPKGLGNKKAIEELLTRPGSGYEEYNAEAVVQNGGAGIMSLMPGPIPNIIAVLLADTKHKIEYQFGIFETMMGSGQASPETFKGTMAIDEFGQRRMRSKLKTIERSLSFAGTVLLEWMTSYYDIEKIVRISEPGTEPRKLIFNEDQDVAGQTIKKNDLSRAKWDIAVVAGSSTPVNRWAEIESMKEIAFTGAAPELIPAIIERLDIPNAAETANQIRERINVQGQLQSLQEKLREVMGDLQTARRESLQDEKKVELMKFKTRLDQVYTDYKAGLEIDGAKASARLETEVNKILNEIENTEVIREQDELSKGTSQ